MRLRSEPLAARGAQALSPGPSAASRPTGVQGLPVSWRARAGQPFRALRFCIRRRMRDLCLFRISEGTHAKTAEGHNSLQGRGIPDSAPPPVRRPKAAASGSKAMMPWPEAPNAAPKPESTARH